MIRQFRGNIQWTTVEWLACGRCDARLLRCVSLIDATKQIRMVKSSSTWLNDKWWIDKERTNDVEHWESACHWSQPAVVVNSKIVANGLKLWECWIEVGQAWVVVDTEILSHLQYHKETEKDKRVSSGWTEWSGYTHALTGLSLTCADLSLM